MNSLLTGLSYMFDCLVRSFIQNSGEFFSPLCISSCDSIITESSLPLFDDSFKDCIDLICQPQHADLYDRIKRFCIDNWIAIYNHNYNQHGKTTSELIHDFELALTKQLEEIVDVELHGRLDLGIIRESVEQMMMNLVGCPKED